MRRDIEKSMSSKSAIWNRIREQLQLEKSPVWWSPEHLHGWRLYHLCGHCVHVWLLYFHHDHCHFWGKVCCFGFFLSLSHRIFPHCHLCLLHLLQLHLPRTLPLGSSSLASELEPFSSPPAVHHHQAVHNTRAASCILQQRSSGYRTSCKPDILLPLSAVFYRQTPPSAPSLVIHSWIFSSCRIRRIYVAEAQKFKHISASESEPLLCIDSL